MPVASMQLPVVFFLTNICENYSYSRLEFRDLRLQPRSRWDLHSSGSLRSECW